MQIQVQNFQVDLLLFVEQGTVAAENGYVFTHNGDATFGTTTLTVSQFSGAGQIIAGTGLD